MRYDSTNYFTIRCSIHKEKPCIRIFTTGVFFCSKIPKHHSLWTILAVQSIVRVKNSHLKLLTRRVENSPWNSWLPTEWYTGEQLRQLVTQIHRSNLRAQGLEIDFTRTLYTYRARGKENSKGVFFFEKRLIRSGRRGREIESSIPGTGFSARGDNNEVSVFRNDANRSLVDQREPTRSLPLSSFAISRPFPHTSSVDFHFPDGSLLTLFRPPFYD